MVDVTCLVRVQEEAVVIHVVRAPVNVGEEGNVPFRTVLLGLNPEEIGGDDIEVSCVEVYLL